MNLSASRSSVQGAQPDVDPTALQRGVADGPHSAWERFVIATSPPARLFYRTTGLVGLQCTNWRTLSPVFCSGCPFQRSCSISQARLVGGWVTWLFYTTRARVYTRQVE